MSYNPFSLKHKTILITGASSGIGKEIAINASKAGAQLIITGRDKSRLEATYSMLEPNKHQIIITDLSSEERIKKLTSELPQLDGVIHSAGIIKRVPLKLISEKSLNELMRINFFAPALLKQLATDCTDIIKILKIGQE
mgnify:CR=1 FL=1